MAEVTDGGSCVWNWTEAFPHLQTTVLVTSLHVFVEFLIQRATHPCLELLGNTKNAEQFEIYSLSLTAELSLAIIPISPKINITYNPHLAQNIFIKGRTPFPQPKMFDFKDSYMY